MAWYFVKHRDSFTFTSRRAVLVAGYRHRLHTVA